MQHNPAFFSRQRFIKLSGGFIFFFCSISLTAQDDPYLKKNIKTGEEVNTIEYTADGNNIIAGYHEGTVEMFGIESEKSILSFKEHWKGVMDIAADPKNKFFVTAGDNTIKVWNMQGDEISRMPDHTTSIYSIDISPDGKNLVSGAINKVFKYWDIKSGKLIKDMKGHTDVTMAVAFSNDGSLIASGSGDNSIKIWDASDLKEIMTLKGHSMDIYQVVFSHNDRYLASCSKDKTIRIYDLESGELYKVLNGHRNFVMDIEFAPGDMHLVSCSFDREIRLWEIPTTRMLYSFIDHDDEVIAVDFAPDGKSFASASYDKTIKIWDYSPEIFVDYYYRNEIIDALNAEEIFLPRQKGESRSDYNKREQQAAERKKEIYADFYAKYLRALENKELPGME